MAVLEPIKLILLNKPINGNNNDYICKVPDFPFDANRGTHEVVIDTSNEIYIDSNDFKLIDSEDFYGLSINKVVGLKYCNTFSIKCDKVETKINENGIEIPTVCYCTCILNSDPNAIKPKSAIQWVSATQGFNFF